MKEENEEQEADIVLDSESDLDDSVIAEEHQGDTIKKLKEKLKVCEAERSEYLTGWQRTKADFVNLRKKDEELKSDFIKFAKEGVLSDLIPVLDSFDLAMQNTSVWEKVDKDWRQGIESIYTQLQSIMTTHGIAKISPLGETFDPAFHEAVQTIPVEDKAKDNIVVTVLQAGYSLGGKSIRPAKVAVGHYEA
jgi:molecular chaperone GrpE